MDEEMLEGVEKIFDGMQAKMKKLKKASYEKNMVEFRENHGHYFRNGGLYGAGGG